MKQTLIGLGEILWDLLPAGKQIGGAPTNFAYHAHALGAEGLVVSRVGADDLGDEILETLIRLGLDCGGVGRDEEHPTGTVSVELDADGKPTYIIHEDVAWDFVALTDEVRERAAAAAGVCFGSLGQRNPVSRAAIREIVQAVPAHGLCIFDINLRQDFYSKEIVADSLELANVLKINDEELPIVSAMFGIAGDEHAQIADLAGRFGLTAVALTRGDKGSLLWHADTWSEHSGYPADIKDTVGAGDAFGAALAMGLLAGHDLDRINDEANRLAAHVCSQHGATPPIPEDIRALFS